MNDTIYKQAAIEVIESELDSIDHVPQWVFDRLTNRLRELPSAEPEYRLDEWCTDCKEYDQERHCCPRFNHVIRATLPKLTAQRGEEDEID